MNITSADTDAWNVAEGSRDGQPTTIRYRPKLKDHLGDSRYPRRLLIIWNYEQTDPCGLPTNEQSDEIRVFEDKIVESLDQDRLAILSFVFTYSGQREWHFYVSDINEVGKRINEALSEMPKLPIELSVHDDPEWQEFDLVLKSCKE